MQIQINTDKNIEGREDLGVHVKRVVERALTRVNDRLTRIEVHLSDQNGDKSGQNDKRCTMEARIAGHRPIAVAHTAPTLNYAIDGAADKLKRSIESNLEKQQNHR